MLAQALDKQYICPGETHPISRAVHLSRLAAFYPACRECPFRTDVGELPKNAVARLQQTERRVERKSLFTSEGVRGIWLNELTRARAAEIAAAFAACLWEAAPMGMRSEKPEAGHRPMRPSVVVGHDERPSAPDIVTGVVSALRRMGCQAIDVGLTTKPCLWFAVEHLQAAGGVFVTGAGCDPSWTGLDFAGRRGMPISSRGNTASDAAADPAAARTLPEWFDLSTIERRLDQPASRPSRQAGPHRTFAASVPYEAGFWKHFHALRPLHVVCGSASRLVRRTLERLFAALPCRIAWIDLPDRVRRIDDVGDPDIVRLCETVLSRRANLGVLIDEDGQRCAFTDERGRLIPAATLTRLLAGLILSEHPRGTIVVEPPQHEVMNPAGAPFCEKTILAGGTQADIARGMHAADAVFAGGSSGRWWFREAFPTCDAILALAKTLDLLSRSDLDFSDVAVAPT